MQVWISVVGRPSFGSGGVFGKRTFQFAHMVPRSLHTCINAPDHMFLNRTTLGRLPMQAHTRSSCMLCCASTLELINSATLQLLWVICAAAGLRIALLHIFYSVIKIMCMQENHSSKAPRRKTHLCRYLILIMLHSISVPSASTKSAGSLPKNPLKLTIIRGLAAIPSQGTI